MYIILKLKNGVIKQIVGVTTDQELANDIADELAEKWENVENDYDFYVTKVKYYAHE